MAGICCWMFFSCGFQHTFSSKTTVKAFDHDLLRFRIVSYMYMGQHAHFLCARDHVQPPLARHLSDSAFCWD